MIVKDMMLTGYDSPPLHTLYLDRPLKGALLMQTLARVNRTYRGKEDGLLVAYAPLADNLQKALSEYTQDDQNHKPLGRNIEEAVALTGSLVATIRELLPHYWTAARDAGGTRRRLRSVTAAVNYLRNPATAGNQVAEGEESLAARYRKVSSQLARAWAICGGSETLAPLHAEVRFYEEVRIWMAKYDAEDRQSRGEPIPEEIQRLLGQLLAESTVSGEVLDIYAAAGMPKPTLTDLTPDFVVKTQQASNPHLAIEALRKLLNEESTKATRSNVVRQRAFSERLCNGSAMRYPHSVTTSTVRGRLDQVQHSGHPHPTDRGWRGADRPQGRHGTKEMFFPADADVEDGDLSRSHGRVAERECWC